jgi:steroid delta-isomerase-like uncharacterized protein
VSELRALVDRFYDAYNRGDVDAAVACYAEDGRHVEVAQGRVAEGREHIAAGLRHFGEAFPDAHWAVERTIVGEGEAAVTYLLTGTLQARLGPFEPNGQKLEVRGVHVFAFDAGAIRQTEDYWDSGTFGRQMRPPQS